MKKVTFYQAPDGALFNTEAGCLKYEAILWQVTEIFSGVWHPGADNHTFNCGRQPVEHPAGTRARLIAALLPIFRAAVPRGPADDAEYLRYLSAYFAGNTAPGLQCLVAAHKRLMSMDEQDREWCDPYTRVEKSDGVFA